MAFFGRRGQGINLAHVNRDSFERTARLVSTNPIAVYEEDVIDFDSFVAILQASVRPVRFTVEVSYHDPESETGRHAFRQLAQEVVASGDQHVINFNTFDTGIARVRITAVSNPAGGSYRVYARRFFIQGSS